MENWDGLCHHITSTSSRIVDGTKNRNVALEVTFKEKLTLLTHLSCKLAYLLFFHFNGVVVVFSHSFSAKQISPHRTINNNQT